MSALEWFVVIALAALAVGLVLYMLYRRFRVHPILRRVESLSWKSRVELAGRLLFDNEIPIASRALLVLVIGYLALPIDFIPDFIPVFGWIDDVVIVGGGLLLFSRLVPRERLEYHISELKAAEDKVIEVESRPADPKLPDGHGKGAT